MPLTTLKRQTSDTCAYLLSSGVTCLYFRQILNLFVHSLGHLSILLKTLEKNRLQHDHCALKGPLKTRCTSVTQGLAPSCKQEARRPPVAVESIYRGRIRSYQQYFADSPARDRGIPAKTVLKSHSRHQYTSRISEGALPMTYNIENMTRCPHNVIRG